MRSPLVGRSPLTFSRAAVTIAITGLLVTQPRTARAQQPPSSSPAEQFRQMQEMMGPMMRANMQSMMEAALAVLARKETAEQLALFARNYLDALVAKGFSREEALRLVAAHTPTLLPGAR